MWIGHLFCVEYWYVYMWLWFTRQSNLNKTENKCCVAYFIDACLMKRNLLKGKMELHSSGYLHQPCKSIHMKSRRSELSFIGYSSQLCVK